MSGIETITRRLTDLIDGRGGDLDDLALDLYAFQYERIEVVRRLADRLGRPPRAVRDWLQIPALPSAAFKGWEMFAGDEIVRTFASSGTSGQPKSRSPFGQRGLDLMDVSIRVNAQRSLFPDGRATRILVLAPPPEAAPEMIMAFGMSRLIAHFGLPGSGFLVGPGGLDVATLLDALAEAEAEGVPVTLIGASFGFVHLLDGLAARDLRLPAAEGSRMMDAGGFKGRSREVGCDALYAEVEARLGIARDRCVNLLGMTELASQIYDNTFVTPGAPRRKAPPPWVRTRVLDPATLAPVGPGEHGVLRHVDLANLERPLVVQSDDVGWADAHGFEVVGRAGGADARGCSLTLEELLS